MYIRTLLKIENKKENETKENLEERRAWNIFPSYTFLLKNVTQVRNGLDYCRKNVGQCIGKADSSLAAIQGGEMKGALYILPKNDCCE